MYLWVVMDETILLRPFGDSPETMGEQLAHVLAMAEHPNVRIQILPLEAGHHGAMDGPLSLLSFPDGPDVVYLEGLGDGEVQEAQQAVKQYAMIYDSLIVKSLSPSDSWGLISRTLKERYGCHPPTTE